MENRLKQKLEELQELVVDAYIEGLRDGDLHPRDFGPVVTLLNQNKIVIPEDVGVTQHQKIKKILKKKK